MRFMDEVTRDDLPETFQLMADTIGMEPTKLLMEKYAGTEVYFPRDRGLKTARRRYIQANYGKMPNNEIIRHTGISRAAFFNVLNSKPR